MLTVWRKLHVETDSMVRPTFSQNTFNVEWFGGNGGPAPTQVTFGVVTPNPWQSDNDQFTGGYVDLRRPNATTIVEARILQYVDLEAMQFGDQVTINLPDCGGGQSGFACLGGVLDGTAVLGDDDLANASVFGAEAWGCDNVYAPAATAAMLSPPDLSAMQLRYRPAYIEPVHETEVSGTGNITTFLRNVNFDVNDGKVLWDQVIPPTVRNLPVSTANYWTVFVLAAWQAEEAEDADPNSEDQVGNGVTKGISTHRPPNIFSNDTQTFSSLGPQYTGICVVFKAVFGETSFVGDEKYTVVHEVGHTFGLDHNDVDRDDPPVDVMDPLGDGQMLRFSAKNLRELRDYRQP